MDEVGNKQYELEVDDMGGIEDMDGEWGFWVELGVVDMDGLGWGIWHIYLKW